MGIVHIALATAAGCLVAATSSGRAALRRRGEELPLLGHIIGGALLVGNAACLLPSAPAWYRVAVIVASVAGMVWFVTTVASRRPAALPDDATLIARDIYAGRTPTRPRPQLRLVTSEPAPARPAPQPARPSVVEATVVEDEPQVATQVTFAAASPAGSIVPTGSAYVAAHLGEFVDTRHTRRAHGHHVARVHDGMDPTTRFLRLAEAYDIDRGPRSLGRSSMA